MKPAILLLVASTFVPLTVPTESTPLDPSDSVTASFVRDFERAAISTSVTTSDTGSESDRLPEMFRAAPMRHGTRQHDRVAVADAR